MLFRVARSAAAWRPSKRPILAWQNRPPWCMDPTTEVALAFHGAPGVYAILLGSGVSRGAGIPTGWEVTLDLVRRLAVASDHPEPEDPERWYVDEYGEVPDYSDILEGLAVTSSERQALLRPYFEPTDEERQEGLKTPTAAHRAVADLAARGTIRIFLTTNFDRLLEQALDAAGVPFDVWASADAIAGGVPLTHGHVVVVKLHGDYRDTRLRNTLTELESYSPTINQLLDRIIDEFGLVICGWSGVWDAALRSAMLRATNRRYRTFWAARHGHLDEAATELVEHRGATVVPVPDADTFFTSVRDKLEALEESQRPHPASTKLAVAMVKRYIPDEGDRIRLMDTVMEEARRLHQRLGPDRYPLDVSSLTWEDAADTVRRYEAHTETMVGILAQLGALGDRADHAALTARALELIANPEGALSGRPAFINLRRYPALLCFYATGLGAVGTENWHLLRAAAVDPRWQHLNDSHHLVAALHPYRIFENANSLAQLLATGDANGRRHTPISDRLHEVLKEPLRQLTDTDQRYDEVFDWFEYLAGVLTEHLRLVSHGNSRVWVPPGYVGRLRWRYRHSETLPPAEWAADRARDLAPALFADSEAPEAAFTAAREAYAETIEETCRRIL